MAKLINMEAVLDAMVEIVQHHDIDNTPYQEDIYLYIDDNGVGTVETFVNVGGNSWLDDDHITVMRLAESTTDWTDFVPEISSVADVLDWEVHTLRERVAAWRCESGWQYDAEEIDYSDIRDFINAHPVLLNQITDAEIDQIRENTAEYREQAEAYLKAALDEQEVLIV